MGNRDFRKREKKKPRKDEKKLQSIIPSAILPQPTIEVIKKVKKKPEELEEEE